VEVILAVMKGKGNIGEKGQGIGMEEVEGEWKYWRGECRVQEKGKKNGPKGNAKVFRERGKGREVLEKSGARERNRGS
jgi:hypothetical protein